MLSFKTIFRYIGMLVMLEGILLLICFSMALLYHEENLETFGLTSAVTIALGSMMYMGFRGSRKAPNRRESYFIVAIVWIVFSFIGMFPFLISGYCQSVATAFFEAMSGFSTTGATAFANIDDFPHSLLFWRSLTHWIGGLGIVFFTITLLPNNIQGGNQLFSVERTGMSTEKIHPRSGTTAKWLWSLYTFLTVMCFLSLWLCGMTPFDSVNFAMSALATGGFSPRTDGVMHYDSPLIDGVLIVFMLLASLNFTLLYLALFKRKVKQILFNEEIHVFLLVLAVTIILSAISLVVFNDYSISRAIRVASFNMVSLQTTTGFVNDNYSLWYPPLWFVLMIVVAMGGCSGSTTGGMKIVRVLIIFKTFICQFQRLLHPKAVIPVRINRIPVYELTENVLLSYFSLFVLLTLIGSVAFQVLGLPALDSVGLSLTCLSNVGPVSGHVFTSFDSLAELPDTAKWICSFLMLAGRLEIFSVLLPLSSVFWRKD